MKKCLHFVFDINSYFAYILYICAIAHCHKFEYNIL